MIDDRLEDLDERAKTVLLQLLSNSKRKRKASCEIQKKSPKTESKEKKMDSRRAKLSVCFHSILSLRRRDFIIKRKSSKKSRAFEHPPLDYTQHCSTKIESSRVKVESV